MTKPVSADQLVDVANIELAERAQELLDEGRDKLRHLDSRFLGMYAAYLAERNEVVVNEIVPAKKILGEPAYSEGQHLAVIRCAVKDARRLGIPDNLTDTISKLFSGILAVSVDAQVQILGGPGMPPTHSEADLHRAQ